jgi:hypothetical protein
MNNFSEDRISNTWDGFCPESLIKGKRVRMRLNKFDFFESEETGLQISIIPGVQAVILKLRGTHEFIESKIYADERANGELLSPQNSDVMPFNNPTECFQNGGAVIDYIESL